MAQTEATLRACSPGAFHLHISVSSSGCVRPRSLKHWFDDKSKEENKKDISPLSQNLALKFLPQHWGPTGSLRCRMTTGPCKGILGSVVFEHLKTVAEIIGPRMDSNTLMLAEGGLKVKMQGEPGRRVPQL